MVDFNNYTKNRYSYLRLKKVELFEYEKKANLFFLIPAEIYENVFDNAIFADLKKFCAKIAPTYKCSFFFNQLVITEDIVKDFLLELLATNYPFLAVSINKSCIYVSINDNIQISVKIERDICAMLEKSEIIKKIVLTIEDEFGLDTYITVNVVDVGEIKVEQSEHRIVSKTVVPFIDYEFLCGATVKYVVKPVFIDSINKAYDMQSVCGIVKSIEKRTFAPDPNSKLKYYKYNYRIKIFDFSGDMTCYFKTNEDNCKLNEILQGMEIMLSGKIGFSERTGSYQMYAKSIFKIQLDKAKIEDRLKPLPVPEKLKYPSRTYDGNDFVVTQNLFDIAENVNSNSDFDCVFMTYKSVNKSFSPWEICMLSFEKGHCKGVYEKFVKVSSLDKIDVEYKAKVMSAKRFAEYVPDILSFCRGKTLYVKDADEVQKVLSSVAKAQHYEFNLELQEANKIGAKNGQKFEPTFERMLKEYSITLTDDSCYASCVAMAKLFIKVKK